jgi:hypothetical protein
VRIPEFKPSATKKKGQIGGESWVIQGSLMLESPHMALF